MRALIVVGLAALLAVPFGSRALGHAEPVTVRVVFPTAEREGLTVTVVGTNTSFRIAGAALRLTSTGPLKLDEELPEVGPGEYRLDREFPPGRYGFTLTDVTYPDEALSREIPATLPRPPDQDAFVFDWPATGASGSAAPTRAAGPAVPWAVLLPVLAVALGGLALALRSRFRPPAG